METIRNILKKKEYRNKHYHDNKERIINHIKTISENLKNITTNSKKYGQGHITKTIIRIIHKISKKLQKLLSRT